VIKPLTDKSLCFETCLIMRADQDSRAVNEYARAFLRKYAPQLVAAKQMDLPLPPEVSEPRFLDTTTGHHPDALQR